MNKGTDQKEFQKTKLFIRIGLCVCIAIKAKWSDLKGIEISLVKLIDGDTGVATTESRTHVGVNQAAHDPVPILSIANSLLEPVRVITYTVLLIPSIRQNLTGAAVGDDKGEDGKTEPEEYEKEHSEKVKP